MGSIEHLDFSADPSGVVVQIGEDEFGRPVTAPVDMAEIEAALTYIRSMKLDRAYAIGVGVLDESQWRELAAAVVAAQARLEQAASELVDVVILEALEQLADRRPTPTVLAGLVEAVPIIVAARAGVTP